MRCLPVTQLHILFLLFDVADLCHLYCLLSLCYFFHYCLSALLFCVNVVICYYCEFHFVKMSGNGNNKYVSINDKLKASKKLINEKHLERLQLTAVYAKLQKVIGAVTEIKLNSVLLLKVLIATYNRKAMTKNDYEMSSEALFLCFSKQRKKEVPFQIPSFGKRRCFSEIIRRR